MWAFPGRAWYIMRCRLPRANPLTKWRRRLKRLPSAVTRMGQLVAQEAARRLGVPFGVVDLIAGTDPGQLETVLPDILEADGAGASAAPMARLRLWLMLNDAVKKGGVMASSSCGWPFSGAFIPVSEDEGMIACCR